MNHSLKSGLLASLLICGASLWPMRADELADRGRDVFTKHQHAVVTVAIVLKTTYTSGGQTSAPAEGRQDLTGTVVDPSGLTVMALSACDPGEMYQRVMPEQSRYKVETEVSDLRILLADGTELPAEIVLRDKDLDLAYVRPKVKPAAPLDAVDLSKAAPAQLLDQVVALNRLNKATSRAYAASIERISAVVQKPRLFYIPDTTMSTTTLGSPAFLPDGSLLGIFVLRAVSSGGTERPNATTIILPASDILKGAQQAPEAKGEPEKKDAPKDAAKETAEPKDAGKK